MRVIRKATRQQSRDRHSQQVAGIFHRIPAHKHMAVTSRAPNIVIALCIATDETNKANTQSKSLQDNIVMRTPVHRASRASKIAPTDISNTWHNIVEIMRKAVVNIMRKAVPIELMAVISVMRKAVTTILATVAVLNIVRKAVVNTMHKAGSKGTIGTPIAIMQTHANTKYSTGIAKESCKGW